jgi:hypothetical protein
MEPNPYDAPHHGSKPTPPARRPVQWWKVWVAIAIGSFALATVVEVILKMLGIELVPLPN